MTIMTPPTSRDITLVDQSDLDGVRRATVDVEEFVEITIPGAEGCDFAAVRLELHNGDLWVRVWMPQDLRDDAGPSVNVDVGKCPT